MFSLDDLAEIIDRRADASAEKSYTRSLLDKGAAHCARKFGEEAIELTIAARRRTRRLCARRPPTCSTISWCCCARAASPSHSVVRELESRTRQSGHEEKAARGA